MKRSQDYGFRAAQGHAASYRLCRAYNSDICTPRAVALPPPSKPAASRPARRGPTTATSHQVLPPPGASSISTQAGPSHRASQRCPPYPGKDPQVPAQGRPRCSEAPGRGGLEGPFPGKVLRTAGAGVGGGGGGRRKGGGRKRGGRGEVHRFSSGEQSTERLWINEGHTGCFRTPLGIPFGDL